MNKTDVVQQAEEMLEGSGVYLSGPIRCVEDNGKGWRNQLIEDYEFLNFNNPLDHIDPDEQIVLNDPKYYNPESEGREQLIPSDYVSEDKMMIQKSDCVFVGLPDAIARGTMMEVQYAFHNDIPVYVWKIDEQEESGWLFFHSDFMSSDRDQVVDQMIEEVDFNE